MGNTLVSVIRGPLGSMSVSVIGMAQCAVCGCEVQYLSLNYQAFVPVCDQHVALLFEGIDAADCSFQERLLLNQHWSLDREM